MSDQIQHQETTINNFSNKKWSKVNSYGLVTGMGIGLILYFLNCAFKGEWIDLKSLFFQLLFSVVITFCIINSIFISQKLLKLTNEKGWLFLVVYYLSSIIGMLIAIEVIYLMRAWIYNLEYHFFHLEEARSSIMIVIIVCTVIYVYTFQKRVMQTKLREKDIAVLQLSQMKTRAELATLQSKINPHFLYNSLNAIASLIHENPDKAERMTIQLSKLFRYSINQNQESLVTVEEEMEIVSTYLDIEKVRFGDRINFIISVDNELMKTKIPRFLIQPLIENALKHGLKDMVNGAELRIGVQKADKVIITIGDNGIPFPDELETGYGLQSTYEKLKLLYDEDYEVQITNQPVKQITIFIPFINE